MTADCVRLNVRWGDFNEPWLQSLLSSAFSLKLSSWAEHSCLKHMPSGIRFRVTFITITEQARRTDICSKWYLERMRSNLLMLHITLQAFFFSFFFNIYILGKLLAICDREYKQLRFPWGNASKMGKMGHSLPRSAAAGWKQLLQSHLYGGAALYFWRGKETQHHHHGN